MLRNYRIACFALGVVLAVAGITSLWITSHSVEKSDGVFVALGSSVIRLHDVGLLPVLVQVAFIALLYVWSTSGHFRRRVGDHSTRVHHAPLGTTDAASVQLGCPLLSDDLGDLRVQEHQFGFDERPFAVV